MPSETLTIVDNRTGKTYEIPIENGTIHATDLRKIRTDSEDFGLMSYDPGFMNTAACKSRITFIDGDQGILRYRGYPISSLPRKAVSWRWLICCTSANCRRRASSTSS
jgi:citrate synthase